MTLIEWFDPILLGVGSVLLVVWIAAIIDLRTMTIPNIYPMILVALWLPFGVVAVQSGITLTDFGLQALGGILAFFVGVLAFVGRIMGGGDVKLMAALAPLIPFRTLPQLFILIALSGLVWAILFGAYYALKSKNSTDDWKTSFGRLRQAHMPYGPAIALGVTLFYSVVFLIA